MTYVSIHRRLKRCIFCPKVLFSGEVLFLRSLKPFLSDRSQSRFGDKLLGFRLLRPKKGTTPALKTAYSEEGASKKYRCTLCYRRRHRECVKASRVLIAPDRGRHNKSLSVRYTWPGGQSSRNQPAFCKSAHNLFQQLAAGRLVVEL